MSQLILQFVGPDMTGKTEIAKAVSGVLGVPYFKASSEHETYLGKQNRFIQQLRHADPRMVDFLRQTGYSVVFDRGFPCEFAYSRALDRATDMEALRHVDHAYAALGTRIVVCYRESYEGIVDDIDASIDQAVLERLELEYRRFAEWSACEVMFLPVDDENLDREVADTVAWLQRHELADPAVLEAVELLEAEGDEVKGDPNYARRRARGRCWGCCQENCGFSKDCGCTCHGGL